MNETYLNIIALIISVAFLSAVIIGTTPPVEREEVDIGPDLHLTNMESNNTTPLVFETLDRYFGTEFIKLHSPREEPPPASNPKIDEMEMLKEIEYDDDDKKFLEVVDSAGRSISKHAFLCEKALSGGNRQLLTERSKELLQISLETSEQVEYMDVSNYFIEEKRNYQAALLRMIAASSSFSRGLPNSETELQNLQADLSAACDMLNSARQEIAKKAFLLDGHHPAHGMYSIRVDIPSEREKALQKLSNSILHPLPDDLLPMDESFRYMDSRKANDILITPRYATVRSTFWYADPETGETIHVSAPEATRFVVVHIQVTHAGNRDGRHYTISTPQPSAFRLHGVGEVFTPIQTETYTSLGEMYTQTNLDRKESTRSSLIFEVPYGMELSDAYLEIDLGSVWGKPGWKLSSA